jgi:hypothetical protein
MQDERRASYLGRYINNKQSAHVYYLTALTAQPSPTQRGPLFTGVPRSATSQPERIGSSAPTPSLQPYQTAAAATGDRRQRRSCSRPAAARRSDPVVAVGSARSKSIPAPFLRASLLFPPSFLLPFPVGSDDSVTARCWWIREIRWGLSCLVPLLHSHTTVGKQLVG